MSDRRVLAQEALSIMSIAYDDKDKLDLLVKRIRYAVVFAANSTEIEIMALSKKIADLIQTQGSEQEIRELLVKLKNEVDYLPFD